MAASAQLWLKDIHKLKKPDHFRIMNVCGGHERSISMAGLRGALPEQIELIPGPGCPVCVCPEEDIYQAIQIALHEDVTVAAFGDMLRVPVNVKKSEARSLEQVKAMGADIQPVASPMDVVELAKQNPDRPVVFFAAGFETTISPVAAMLAQGVPDNISILLSGRLTWPAVAMLLESGEAGFDALIAPGHVATVMGSEEWQFVIDEFDLPSAIAGFTPDSLLAAIYSVIRQKTESRKFLDNCYPQLVKKDGNPGAKNKLYQVMDVVDANWRGIGTIPSSGFALNEAYAQYDARLRFPTYIDDARKHAGEMPPGCDCAKVVLGKLYPNQCRLYGTACKPRSPIGPCMVSDEGACRIWWSAGVRENAA